MRFHIPSDVIWIMQQITGQKEEVFLVGGCVRDLLLNRPVHDYDMTTSMPAEAMISLFSQLDCNVVPTGLKHGTVTIIRRHQAVEITTYRTESSYLQHRRPANVQFTRSLKEDLKRRDFTINAMAYHPDHGIIDCFHSQEDLKQNLIRCVGNSEERFTEDALRIMRAIRFHCQLSFSLHPKTADYSFTYPKSASVMNSTRSCLPIRKIFCNSLKTCTFSLIFCLKSRSFTIMNSIVHGIYMMFLNIPTSH